MQVWSSKKYYTPLNMYMFKEKNATVSWQEKARQLWTKNM